jgi:peptidylamidoglycolate lyase
MLLKKILYGLALLAAIIILAYLFQPAKKGSGKDQVTRYQLVEGWPALPQHITLGNPTGLAMDTSDNVVVFHRAGRSWPLLGSMPSHTIESKTILVIDSKTGRLKNSWGDHLFIMPHGLTIDRDNNVWVTDVGLRQVFKFTSTGRLLMKLGQAKTPGNDPAHFNRPTDVGVAPDGSFYVSDGYGNNRIIKFSAEGKYLFEWGRKGNEVGQFNLPHGIDIDEAGNVYVADRENNRIQVFDPLGKFLKAWSDNSFASMCSVCFNPSESRLFAVDDHSFFKIRHRGSDVLTFDSAGTVQTRFGRSGGYNCPVSWYHDLTFDREDNIYIGDILGNTIQKFEKVRSR